MKFDPEKHEVITQGNASNIRCKTCNKYYDRCICGKKKEKMKYKVFNKLTKEYDPGIIVGQNGEFYRETRNEGYWPLDSIDRMAGYEHAFKKKCYTLYDEFDLDNRLNEYWEIDKDIQANGPGKYLRIEMEKE